MYLSLSIAAAGLLGLPGALAFTSPCENGFVPFPIQGSSPVTYACEPYDAAFKESMDYMRSNLPSFDITNQVSLGFASADPFTVNAGIANVGTNISLGVRSAYQWAADIPKDIFLEYVLPYSSVNEARTNWRQLMLPIVQSILADTGDDLDQYTIADVVYAVNNGLWSGAMGKDIVFKSSQTPLIYDPMSVLSFGYGSCTGVSIFLIDALRSVGVPCRIAGTPAWNGQTANGNHNWVEVWNDSYGWEFIEAVPAGGGESLSNPCDKWFCTPANMAGGTAFFGARFLQSESTRYPMAWDLGNTAIPGENRTLYYQLVCNAC